MYKITLKEINRLAIPAIISGIAEPIISLVDTAIIGHLGATELGGVGIASSFFLLIIWVLAQTKSAISAVVSKFYGKNELEKITTLITQAMLINLFLGFLVLIATYPFSDKIFQFYGAAGSLLSHGVDYFEIRALGFPIVLATFGLFGVFRGLQNTSWAMQISILGGVVNLLLDVILVFGIKGFIEPMGVKGAALASLIAQLVMFILAVIYFLKNTPFDFKFTLKINPEISALLGMSFNLFIRTLSLNVAYFLGNKFATGYGEAFIAAHTIAMNIWLFSAFFIDGYANAGNAIAGRLLGEGNYPELINLARKVAKISVVIGTFLGLFYTVSYPLIGSFFTSESLVIQSFNTIFWLVIISQPINGVAFAYDGIFKGLGEAKYLRNTLVVGTFFCFIPVIFITDYFDFQLGAIWLAFLGWMIFRGGSLWWKFNKMFPDSK